MNQNKNSTQNLLDYNLQLDGCTVTSSTVKNLGVILDSRLSFENQISHVTKTAFFYLRNIAKLRNMLTVSDEEKLRKVTCPMSLYFKSEEDTMQKYIFF